MSEEERFSRFIDMLSEMILEATDQEIIDDCVANGEDPEEIAAKVRKLVASAVEERIDE